MKESNRMKLIFLDIDGTLTEAGENTPPDSALRAIEKARQQGNKVFLCSGRNIGMAKPVLDYGFDGIIALAGAYVMAEKEVIYDQPMDPADFDDLLKILHEDGVFCTAETKDRTYGDENLSDFLSTADSDNSEIERWRKALQSQLGIQPMKNYDGSPAYKIVIMCNRASQLARARELYEKDYDFVIQEVKEHGNCINGELIHRSFDKGSGDPFVPVGCFRHHGTGDLRYQLPLHEAFLLRHDRRCHRCDVRILDGLGRHFLRCDRSARLSDHQQGTSLYDPAGDLRRHRFCPDFLLLA